jgi:hypothetical protein
MDIDDLLVEQVALQENERRVLGSDDERSPRREAKAAGRYLYVPDRSHLALSVRTAAGQLQNQPKDPR